MFDGTTGVMTNDGAGEGDGEGEGEGLRDDDAAAP